MDSGVLKALALRLAKQDLRAGLLGLFVLSSWDLVAVLAPCPPRALGAPCALGTTKSGLCLLDS